MAQMNYEEFLKKVVDPDTNEYYPARNKEGNELDRMKSCPVLDFSLIVGGEKINQLTDGLMGDLA